MSSLLPADLIGALISASAPVVSPDGEHVVFVVTQVDVEANEYRSRLWLGRTGVVEPPRPLTAGEARDGNPAWSPDGRSLAFTSRRGTDPRAHTIHVLPMDGPGEPIIVARLAEPATGLRWSPDGMWIAFTARRRDERYDETDPRRQPPRRITRFLSSLDGEGWVHDRPEHVWAVPGDGTAAPIDLTPGEFAFSSPAWRPDSTGLVVEGAGHDTWDLDLASDLWAVALDGTRQRLTPGTGNYHHPAVSPDGERVAFLGTDDPLTYPQNVKVGVLELAEGATIRWVSDALDRTFAPIAGTRSPVWCAAGLLATAEDRGDVHVHLVDPAGVAAPVRVTNGPGTVHGFDLAGGVLATARSAIEHPAEIWLSTPEPDAPSRRLSTIADRFVARTRPRPAQSFLAPSSDGVEVDAWIVTPPDLDPARRYPVLLNVHGGPFSQYGHTYFDEAQVQAAAGFVVLMANPRGSSGRHREWGQAILGPRHPVQPGRGWGSVDVEDVVAVLDEALRRFPFCDPERVGMLGGSYGGYMATWLAAHHGDRFRAICSERAVNNLVSEEWNSDVATTFRTELGPTHLEDPAEYRRMSPITYVDRIHTPMLILHSENDLRCPITQADELFVALRLLGRDVTYVRFPAEGHELSRSGSPKHRVQRAELILEFFARHLGPGT